MSRQTIKAATENGLARAVAVEESKGWKKVGKSYQDKDAELAWGDVTFCQDVKK